MANPADDEPFGHLPDRDPDGDPGDELLPPLLADRDRSAPTADRIPHRYRSSFAASALAAGMIGLRDVLEEVRDDRPVVEQHAHGGDRRRPVEVRLDPDEPGASTATVRPPVSPGDA